MRWLLFPNVNAMQLDELPYEAEQDCNVWALEIILELIFLLFKGTVRRPATYDNDNALVFFNLEDLLTL